MIKIKCSNPNCENEYEVRFKSDARKKKYCSKQCIKDHHENVRNSKSNWWEDAYKSSIKQLNITG